MKQPWTLALAAALLGSLVAACSVSSSPGDAGLAYDGGPKIVPLHCDHRDPLRMALFGDLHVHTAASFDAAVFGTKLTAADAYDVARGKQVTVFGGATVRLSRPLDFAAVTDHSEFLGEVSLCHDASQPAYASDTCAAWRANAAKRGPNGEHVFERSLVIFAAALILPGPSRDRTICGDDERACADRAATEWQRQQAITEAVNDATGACTFSSLHAYEWSATPGNSHNHRNILFRSDVVPQSPVTYYDQQTPEDMWAALRQRCMNAGSGCDAIAIPHNSNLSNGLTFRLEDGLTAEAARARSQMEPLVEIYQNKGQSECKPGADSSDALCDFEQENPPVCDGANAASCLPLCADDKTHSKLCDERLSYVRNALKEGLVREQALGENPLKLGFIGSTDTHNATPGAVEEYAFRGHLGVWDSDPQDRLDTELSRGSGGLAVVWAEENSREAIFQALRRREAYGTTGPRLQVRFFGGWGYPKDMCAHGDFAKQGYAGGVPMGGDLPAPPTGNQEAPRFAIGASKDPGTADHPGSALQHVQVVKGWVDGATGLAREKIYEVAGDAMNGASVDTKTCAQAGAGSDQLCTVWSDPDFHVAERAFYYVRVFENPSCRHTAWDCQQIPIDKRPAYCSDDKNLILQERAWSSPIWYRP